MPNDPQSVFADQFQQHAHAEEIKQRREQAAMEFAAQQPGRRGEEARESLKQAAQADIVKQVQEAAPKSEPIRFVVNPPHKADVRGNSVALHVEVPPPPEVVDVNTMKVYDTDESTVIRDGREPTIIIGGVNYLIAWYKTAACQGSTPGTTFVLRTAFIPD